MEAESAGRPPEERVPQPQQLPQAMVGVKEIFMGLTALNKANVILIGRGGAQANESLQDGALEGIAEFNRVVGTFGFNPSTLAHVLADATSVGMLPRDSPLYLEGLCLEADRIASDGGSTYPQMGRVERLKLASFLYRPQSERPLTREEKVALLFDLTKIFKGRFDPHEEMRVEAAVEPEADGLRKVLWVMVEAGDLENPPYAQVSKLWAERGWFDYAQISRGGYNIGKKGQKGNPQGNIVPGGDEPATGERVRQENVSVYYAHHNLPEAIENILRDTMALIGEDRNLDVILANANGFLPHRARLNEIGYFSDRTSQPDRLAMLNRIVHGEGLW